MPFIHEIEKINKYIQNIDFKNCARDENNYYTFYKFIIEACEHPSGESVMYEYCMDSYVICSEDFGYYYTKISPSYDGYNEYPGFERDKDGNYKIPDELKKYIGEKIEKIIIYEMPNKENNYNVGSSMIMEINLEDNKKFYFTLYNYHNGYYSHSVWLNVYENKDKTPMCVLQSII